MALIAALAHRSIMSGNGRGGAGRVRGTLRNLWVWFLDVYSLQRYDHMIKLARWQLRVQHFWAVARVMVKTR